MRRYKVKADGNNAFVVYCTDESVERSPVRVALAKHNTGIVIDLKHPEDNVVDRVVPVYDNEMLASPFDDLSVNCISPGYKFHAYAAITRAVALKMWTRKNGLQVRPNSTRRRPFPGFNNWLLGRTAKAFSQQFHEHWKRLLSQVDETVLQIDKRLFSCSGANTVPYACLNPLFWEQKYLISDIMRFRSAALITDYSRSLIASQIHRYPDPRELLDRLVKDWKLIVSYSGQLYTSLSKTLMNFPAGIAFKTLDGLSRTLLVRPLHTKLELSVTVFAQQSFNREGVGITDAINSPVLRTLMLASPNEIKECMKKIHESKRGIDEALTPRWLTRSALSRVDVSHTRKTSSIKDFVIFVTDPFLGFERIPYQGKSLSGMTNRAIEWHKDILRRDRQNAIRWEENRASERIPASPETKTALPPIDLPDCDNVKFLMTVQDIINEGTLLENCIRSYSHRAVKGTSYLFHVDYNGEQAAVEVTNEGDVRQAKGPRNCDNEASRWARQYFERWSKPLRQQRMPA